MRPNLHVSVFLTPIALLANAIAGDLDPPPGPIVPAFKTLDDINPGKPVQSLSGSGSALYVINQAGMYYLTGNIESPGPGLHAINITASGVTLDLNGFAILGGNGETNEAVRVAAFAAEIRNGSISGWRGGGVLSFFPTIIRNVRFNDVGADGFFGTGAEAVITGIGSVIDRCHFFQTGPVSPGSGSVIRNSAFVAPYQSVIIGEDAEAVRVSNVSIQCAEPRTDAAIVLGDNAYIHNVSIGYPGPGIRVNDRAFIMGCTVDGTDSNGLVYGIQARDAALIRDCVVKGHSFLGIYVGRLGESSVGVSSLINNNVNYRVIGVNARDAYVRDNTIMPELGAPSAIRALNAQNSNIIDNLIVGPEPNTNAAMLATSNNRIANNQIIGVVTVIGNYNHIDANNFTGTVGTHAVVNLGATIGNIVSRNVFSASHAAPIAGMGNGVAATNQPGFAGYWHNIKE